MKKLALISVFITGFSYATSCPAPKPFAEIPTEKAALYDYQRLVASVKKSTEELSDAPDSDIVLPKLLNLWAIWCAPCRAELPLLGKLAQQGNADIALINIDDTEADAKNMLKSLNIKQINTYLADYELMSQLAIVGLPATIVYAQDHVFLGVGVLKNEAELTDWLTCLGNHQPSLDNGEKP